MICTRGPTSTSQALHDFRGPIVCSAFFGPAILDKETSLDIHTTRGTKTHKGRIAKGDSQGKSSQGTPKGGWDTRSTPQKNSEGPTSGRQLTKPVEQVFVRSSTARPYMFSLVPRGVVLEQRPACPVLEGCGCHHQHFYQRNGPCKESTGGSDLDGTSSFAQPQHAKMCFGLVHVQ